MFYWYVVQNQFSESNDLKGFFRILYKSYSLPQKERSYFSPCHLLSIVLQLPNQRPLSSVVILRNLSNTIMMVPSVVVSEKRSDKQTLQDWKATEPSGKGVFADDSG